jgi:hypothetical protein
MAHGGTRAILAGLALLGVIAATRGQDTTSTPQQPGSPRVIHVQGDVPGWPVQQAVIRWQRGLHHTRIVYAPCDKTSICVTVTGRPFRGAASQDTIAWTCTPAAHGDRVNCPRPHGTDRHIYINTGFAEHPLTGRERAAVSCHELGHALRDDGAHRPAGAKSCMVAYIPRVNAVTVPDPADYAAADQAAA